MSFEYAFLNRIFLRGKIKFLKEVNDREVKTSFEKKGVLAIDSLVTACTCFNIYVMYQYMYVLGLIFISC